MPVRAAQWAQHAHKLCSLEPRFKASQPARSMCTTRSCCVKETRRMPAHAGAVGVLIHTAAEGLDRIASHALVLEVDLDLPACLSGCWCRTMQISQKAGLLVSTLALDC